MAQEEGERACDRCRERRVKCDKRHPACERCEKLGKPCPGYEKKRKFVDAGASLRKKFHFDDDRVPSGSSTDAATATRTSTAANVAVDGPRPLSLEARQQLGCGHSAIPSPQTYTQGMRLSHNPKNHGSVSLGGSPYGTSTPAQHLLPTWTEGTYDSEWFDLDPAAFYGSGGNSCGFLPGIPNIIDEMSGGTVLPSTEPSATPLSTGLGTFSESFLWAPESQLQTSAIIHDEREHEMAFLIRYFTESLGPWMDLFDHENHFTHLVPLKALRDALLRNAIAAVAAKQLGRLGGLPLSRGPQCQRPSTMETAHGLSGADWFYKAANYYDKAISFSREYLSLVSGSLSNPYNPDAGISLPAGKTDDLLIAVSIFSLYESLDDTDAGWIQHLTGFRSLLSAVNVGQGGDDVGRHASFWNFVRADYQAAYARHRKTLLDTDDFALWQQSGLQVTPDGTLYTSREAVKNDPKHSPATTELAAHTLLWLVLRVVNHIASSGADAEQPARQRERWNELCRLLDSWHSSLPHTYQPCAQTRHPTDGRGGRSGDATQQIFETFFSIDVCAATLQLYHFARILLLLHRPPDVGATSGGRLKAYREISREAIRHAHEIIGIALGRPKPAIRVEMLLPLFIAGSTLESDYEREVVLQLLRAIEKDTGCPTESRCQQLITEYWGWNQEPEAVA